MGTDASWANLPHKSRLLVLALCRFAEPLSNTSVLSYLYYLLKSFDGQATPSEIARQAGYVATSFALGQFITGTLWGRLSDTRGRRPVLLIGLSGTICSTLVFGFSQRLWLVVAARLFAGLLNGNVGVLRTMISEIVVEKKHQARAFLIMPMCFNLGAIIGPMIGGLLADPTHTGAPLSWLVGKDSLLGGKTGVRWLIRYPYALPNVISAIFLTCSLLMCWLFLDETLPSRAGKQDTGIIMGRKILRWSRPSRPEAKRSKYTQLVDESLGDEESGYDRAVGTREETTGQVQAIALQNAPADDESCHSDGLITTEPKPLARKKQSQIFTSNVVLTLASFMLCPLHNATFMQLWPLYLSTPTSNKPVAPPFRFSGGLGLSTSDVGYAMSVLGCIGVTLQILVFPRVQGRFGTMACYRACLWIFPLAYTLIPYLSIIPSTDQDHASGPSVWTAIVALLLLQVLARTFALPSTVILLNNSAPDRYSLGTIHGAGSSLASLSRVIGPLTGAFLYGYGEEIGIVGLVWWVLAAVAILGALSSLLIYEGQGLENSDEPSRAI